MHRHTFTVEGRGRFPIDMLRYDRCSPYSETDSYSIESPKDHLNLRRVELVRTDDSKRWKPTTERWQSFGWDVLCCEHH